MKAQILRILTIGLVLLGLIMLAQSQSASAGAWEGDNYGSSTFSRPITGNGQSSYITAQFVNRGTNTWYNSGSNGVSINYRWEPGDEGQNGLSAFSCSNWINDHRPVALNQSSVPPKAGPEQLAKWRHGGIQRSIILEISENQ